MGGVAKAVSNTTGLAYDMYITNDTDENATAYDPFDVKTKMKPGLEYSWFITPGFTVTVHHPNGKINFKG